MNATTTRTHDEITAGMIRTTEDFAFHSFQVGEAAELRGDLVEAEAWFANMDRLFAEANALRATLAEVH